MDELERKERYTELLDLYGSLLGEEQLRRTKEYYFGDYSLTEIAERENKSRNAIHLSIKAAERKLDELESKLKLLHKKRAIEQALERIEESGDNSEECDRIRRILTDGI